MTIERRVRIMQDTDPCDPRADWDCHVGRMYCWHGRYKIGDEHGYADSDDCLRQLAYEVDPGIEEEVDRLENDVANDLYYRAEQHGCTNWQERNEYVERFIRPKIDGLIESALSDGYVILPVNMYDHSGIALSTGQFSCMWDSGQVGWIVCDKETIDKELYGDRGLAITSLNAEVSVYSDYIGGNVYGFIAEEREVDDDEDRDDDDGWEHVDSCWGFYGHDEETNGIRDHLGAEFADCEFIWN